MKKDYKKSQYRQQRRKSIEATTVDFSKNRKETFLAVVIIFCLPVLLYLQTLAFGFTKFDDDLIIQNHIPFLSDFQNAPQAFLTDAFIDGSTRFYRPLQTLSYMVDIALSGNNNTWMYHLTNILLLGVIACLLFLLLRRFLIPLKSALLSTLVYCAHPLFISSIAWIPARGDLLLMLFSLLSFLFFIEFLQKRKIIYLFGHWAAFTIALFCKETAIVLPFLFIVYYFTFPSEKRFEKRYLFIMVLYAVSGICWFWLRSESIGGGLHNNEIMGSIGHSDNVGFVPFLRNLQTIPESLASFFIPFDIDPIPGFSLFKTLTGLGIIVLIGVLFFKNKERSKTEKIFCFLWFLLLLLPTMLYKHNRIDYLNHRFFLPLIGMLLFVLFIFPVNWVKNGSKENTWLIAAVFIGLSSFTFAKTRAYSNPMTFYNSAISRNSDSDLAYNNRGFIYFTQGLYDKAMNDFTKAIHLKPDYAQAYYNRGAVYFTQGLYDKALEDYTKAIEIMPDYAYAYNNRGAVYLNKGLYDKAIKDCTKAIHLKPDYAPAYYNRGIIYLNLGFYDKALEDCTKAIHLKPDYAQAYYDRGNLYKSQGLNNKAIDDYTRAIEIIPDYAYAYNNRGAVFFNQGLYDKSCQDFRKAEELGLKEAKDNVMKFCK
jgi:tetratricopeptide (TPR) repeat protein